MKNKKEVKKVKGNIHKAVVMSSYQKMKQRYEERIYELTDEIIILVDGKDLIKATMIKMKWRMQIDVEKAFWRGDFK